MKIEMAHVERIRWLLHVEGRSQRQVAKLLGISRHTVAKYADRPEVPRYERRKPYPATVLTPAFKARIEQLLAENETLPRKQQWIGHTIYLALKAEGYEGSEPTVRRHVARVRQERRRRAAFIPLAYDPGETAEFDWGEAEVTIGGRRQKVQILCYRLRWSGMPFVAAYPNQRQEALFDGLRRAFETTGGVPLRLTSDNLRQAVRRVLEGRNRQEQDAYRSFRTHYLVESNFCHPGAANEKGSVENLVGFAQRNIIGPRVEAASWEEFNALLWERCLDYAKRVPQGETISILERWQQEQRMLRPLPSKPFDCCRVQPVTSNKVACVTFETCRYSVPVRHANRQLWLRAYWDRVEIYDGRERIAVHPRSYERHREILDLDHYLDLLLNKPGALSQARPFRMAAIPDVYHRFRAELRRRDQHGDREFVRILMLHREFTLEQVTKALEKALHQRVVSYQEVCRLLRHNDPIPSPAERTGRLPAIRVRQPALARYDRLLKGGVVH